MAECNENSSLPIQAISDAQASILDLVLFPGFTRMSTAVQGYLTIDLSVYVPLMYCFGLVVFVCRRMWERLVYDILLLWVSSQSFTQEARSSLATTDLASAPTRFRRSNDGDTKRKTISYTPWNGRFFIRYNGHIGLENSIARSMVSDVRHISTVILNETRRWYSNCGIPYRRGYLLLSIAGYFGLDIYILSLSAINEDRLRDLFAKLPSRCVILVEDIDAVSSKRFGDVKTKDSRQGVTSSPSQQSKSVSRKVSLSTPLNVIDSVGSQEGRVLIMTTNYITHLNKALIRPGRVDKKVELGLADKKMTADLFCLVFKPVEGDIALSEDAQSGENKKVHEAAVSQREEAEKVERVAKGFAARVPELKFSPAKSPVEAIDNVEQLISKPIDTRSVNQTLLTIISPYRDGSTSLGISTANHPTEYPKSLTIQDPFEEIVTTKHIQQ
ncbi:hypothetical protein DL95DRAFT_426043 [Leptodontidium sp. 2 PMI_412]|nr:hypothetical protein DL95DRAFT_426043 [Leptodontidium sp. 2 PMI_412]